jgi:hypothetical protein
MKLTYNALTLLAAILMLGVVASGEDNSATTQPSATTAPTATREPGRVETTEHTETVTVSAVNPDTREVTLKAPDGTVSVYKCGPDVVNFDQIKVGDQVKATVVEQLAIFVRKTTDAPSANQSHVVALAAKGDKPGVVMATTTELTAQVKAIDPDAHTATLTGTNGTVTFHVDPAVNLTNVHVGDNVVIQYTQGIALTVEKP